MSKLYKEWGLHVFAQMWVRGVSNLLKSHIQQAPRPECKPLMSSNSNPSQRLSIAFSSWLRLAEVMFKEEMLLVKSRESAVDLERFIWEEKSFW